MEERRKLITTVIVSAVVVLLLGGALAWQARTLGVGPLDHAESLNSRIAITTKQRDDLQRKIQTEMPKRRDELASYQKSKDLATELLPDEVGDQQIKRFVWEKADLALIEVLNVSRLEPARRSSVGRGGGGGPWEEFVVSLELRGTYDQLALFINYLETFQLDRPDGSTVRRFFEVKNLEVEAEEEGVIESGRHEIKLDVSTYRYKTAQGGGL
jgi:Tfp pilus assembly protein PilO